MKQGIGDGEILSLLKERHASGRPKSLTPTKTVYKSLWITPQLMERIKTDVEFKRCASFGGFVTKAIETYLVRFDGNIEEYSDDCYTPLHHAAMDDNAEAITAPALPTVPAVAPPAPPSVPLPPLKPVFPAAIASALCKEGVAMLTLEQIKDALGDRNLKEVALRAKISYNQVWGVASGKVLRPSYDVVKALSDYLEHTIRQERGYEMSENDLCDLCGGELEHKKTVDLELHVRGELVVCEGLPADVCRQCGEKYFSADVSVKIDQFIEKYQEEKPLRYIPVPVFSGDVVLK